MPSFSRGVLFLLVLLIAALPLYSSATLDAEERQKEQEERDAITEDARKADMAPEPPQDLQVTVVSDSIVLLMWKEPSDTTDLDHYYVYVEDMEDMHKSIEDTRYQWTGLEACTNYTFGVRSVPAVGDMSDPVLGDGRTEVGRPPPPQNLQGESESSTSMTLTWEKPDTPCDVESYRVKWSLDGADTQSTQVTETSYTVPGLLPNTTYILSVSAITSEAEGVAATIQETTAGDEGGPPEDLVAEGVSTSAINVSWSPPPNNPPEYYTVQGMPCHLLEDKVVGLSYLITGLDPCESCSIVVTSIYKSGLKFTASTPGETLGGDPPPPKSCSVEVQDGYPTVSWEAPETLCNLVKYNVLWTSTKLWGDGEEGSGSVNTSATVTHYSITDPVPYSEYRFEISASFDDDFGSPTSCSGTSLETLPGPPVILSAVSEQDAAVVTWETPAEENGLIVNYGIFVDGGTDPVTQVSGDEHTARVEDLQACGSVGLTVKARNGAGWGSSSEAEYVTVIGDVLPENVDCTADDLVVKVCWLPYSDSCPVSRYNLKWEGDVLWSDDLVDSNSTTMEWSIVEICYSISALPYTKYSVELTVGSGDEAVKCSDVTPMAAPGPPTEVNVTTEDSVITVTWSEPEKKNGIIDLYQVEWEDSAGDIGSRTTEDNSTFSSEIQKPSCGVTMNVTVRAKVVDVTELGDASPPVTAYVVNSVKTLNCESSKPGQVSLSWTLEDAACPVGLYNLTWTYNSLWSDDTGESWKIVGKDDLSTNVTSLPPYSSVSLHIHVDNSPEYKDCNATTPEEAPGPPTEVNYATEGLVLIVTWSEPDEKNGIIDLYQVEWEDSAGGIDTRTTEDNSTFSLEIKEVPCGDTVDVTVRAKVVTVDKFGDASPPVTAYIFNSVKTLNCMSSEPGQVSLSWTLEDAECPVGTYNLTWTYDSLWSDDAGKGWQNLGKDDTSTTVTLLPAYSSVFLQIHVDNNPEHTDCSATTPEGASSKPTSVEQIANSTSSVTVAWGQPLSINGILNGWRLRWKTMNGDLIDEDVIDPEDMTHEVTELSPSSSYVVYVMAINGAGDGEPEKIDVTTAYISDHSDSNTGLIIGLSVGGGLLLIVLLVGGFILYRKNSSSKHHKSAPDVADTDSDELYRMQHFSSVNHHYQNKSESVDFGTNSELYTNPRPSMSKLELDVGNEIPSANDKGPVFSAPPSRRFSQQVATSLPRLGAYNRRPSQQVNSRIRNYEEYNRRPSQQDMIGRPSVSGGPGRPPLGEYGRHPSQQIDVGRPNMKDYGRRPSQQVDLGRPNLKEYGRRPSQQANIGRPISGEFARRPSQQVPAVGGSFPTRLPQQGPSRRSSDALYSRRPSQQADPARPGDRMLMKRPSQQFAMNFEGIQEL